MWCSVVFYNINIGTAPTRHKKIYVNKSMMCKQIVIKWIFSLDLEALLAHIALPPSGTGAEAEAKQRSTKVRQK